MSRQERLRWRAGFTMTGLGAAFLAAGVGDYGRTAVALGVSLAAVCATFIGGARGAS